MNNEIAQLKNREVPLCVRTRYLKTFCNSYDRIAIASKAFDNGDYDSVWLRCFDKKRSCRNEKCVTYSEAGYSLQCNLVGIWW